MTVSFAWEFPHWEVSTQSIAGFKGVVTAVAWRLTACDGENEVKVFGTAKLPAPDKNTKFVPKESVTADMLIEWVKPIMGYDAYVVNLTNHLAQQAANTPKSFFEPPPFNKGQTP